MTHSSGMNRKTEKRRDARLNDYAKMVESSQHEAKVAARIRNGGFHKPGSMKKVGG